MRQETGATEARAKARGYLRVADAKLGDFLVKKLSTGMLQKVDAVVFDCDGVLIDARRSYDETIRLVVQQMVEEATGVRLGLAKAMPKLISMMRRTGGFNSDWDTSYGLTLFSLVALAQVNGGRGAKGPRAVKELRRITARFGSAPRGRGQEAVDSFLESESPSVKETLDKGRRHLGYPSTPPKGRMTTLFDELYFGPSLFKKVHGVRASTLRERGLIEKERLLVDKKALESLEEKLGRGRLAIVTGRPYLGTEHSLGKDIMGYFDRGASMFIGDADTDPSLRGKYDGYRKPSPKALERAREKLSSKTLLYVGDSAEDLMMVQNARREGLQGFLFAGVYETSPVEADQASFFEREEADLIVETVKQVPSGLLLSSASEAGRER